LYLQEVFGANYRMVTLIPVAFGAGKWAASLPTGYLLDHLGRRRLMAAGLLVIAVCDVASVVMPVYAAFLGVRGVGGMGWAMFGTVATTLMVGHSGGRTRAVSLLLISEALGLLLGSVAGGSLYEHAGTTSPFFFEATCMALAAVATGVSVPGSASTPGATSPAAPRGRHGLGTVLRRRGVLLMSLTNATLTAVQTGTIVFLFPLYLAEQGRLRPDSVGYLVGLSVLGRLAALWLVSTLSDRRDQMRLLGLGLLAYGVVLGGLTVVSGATLLALWSLFIGAGAGFVAGLPTAIIGDRVAPELHGIAIGWLRTLTDAGMLVGPIVMGALADTIDLRAPFLVAALSLGVLAWSSHRHARTAAASSGS
jgi:MFS family permease